MNKIRWVKKESENTVEVNEDGKWKSYLQSNNFIPDSNGFSKGYLTFLNCLKQNYIVDDTLNLRD